MERYYKCLLLYLKAISAAIAVFGAVMLSLATMDTVFDKNWGLQGLESILLAVVFLALGILFYIIFTFVQRKFSERI